MSRAVAGASVGGLEPFDDLLARWIDAEARGDAVTLDVLLDDEFRGDGPHGYVLTKAEWLDRYRAGDLVNVSFGWRSQRVRSHDGAVVATGEQRQVATYRGRDCSGRFRATLVAVRRERGWAVVNLQLSPLPAPTDPA